MSKKHAEANVPLEGPVAWRVRGAVYPTGSGKIAKTEITLGDGLPPTILMRFGADPDGATVVDITAGGLAAGETLPQSLKGIGALLKEVAAVLTEEEPVKVVVAEKPLPNGMVKVLGQS